MGVRDELFTAELEDELVKCYPPRGQEPCPPALLAMMMLLQRYNGLSDADAVDAAENDRRGQLVLGCLGTERAQHVDRGVHERSCPGRRASAEYFTPAFKVEAVRIIGSPNSRGSLATRRMLA